MLKFAKIVTFSAQKVLLATPNYWTAYLPNTNLIFETIQHASRRSSTINQNHSNHPCRMGKTETSANISSRALAQANHIFDMEEIQNRHKILAEGLQCRKLKTANRQL